VPSLPHPTAAPEPATPYAERIDDLWIFMLVAGTLVFLLFLALLLAGFRRRGPADQPGNPHDLSDQVVSARTGDGRMAEPRARLWLVGGGVVLPVVLLFAVLTYTLDVMRDSPDTAGAAADGMEVVELTGHQWWFEIRYPGAGVQVRDEMHLPLGRPVLLRVTSADVIHSFWVPEFGPKIDMLPETTNTMVIEAERSGEFTARCSEFCGLNHTRMHLRVIVEPEEDYRAWLEAQQ